MTLLEEIANGENASSESEALIYMHEVESWGGGVSKYFSAMAKAGLPPPVAEEQDGFFKIVFWRPTVDATTSKTTPKTTSKHCNDFESVLRGTSLEIYKLIMQQPSITVDGLAAATGFTRNGIKYHIKRLKALVGLRRVGGRRAGKWELPCDGE